MTNRRILYENSGKYFFLLSLISAILFTLLVSVPNNHAENFNSINIDPEATGVIYVGAYIAIFFSVVCLCLFYTQQMAAKILFTLLVICLLTSTYRVISIDQYRNHCQNIQTSVCIIEDIQPLPIW